MATLDDVAAYDLITAFDAIHDQAAPAKVLANIARELRDDGVFLLVNIEASSHVHENLDHPFATFIYTVSTMHGMSVSLGLGGDGLGTAWGVQRATSMLRDAGFATADLVPVEDDPGQRLLRLPEITRWPGKHRSWGHARRRGRPRPVAWHVDVTDRSGVPSEGVNIGINWTPGDTS